MFSKRSFRDYVCVSLVIAICNLSLTGCGGHAANPVDRYMLGDEKKSCNALYAEVANIDKEIVLKKRSKSDRDIWNVIFFVTGFLVIVPWFFIDSKGSQEVEDEALKARKNALQILYHDHNCGEQNAVSSAPQPAASDTILKKEVPVNITKDIKEQQADTVKKGQTLSTTSPSSVIKCGNCGHEIVQNEGAFVHKGQIVCSDCYAKLKNLP